MSYGSIGQATRAPEMERKSDRDTDVVRKPESASTSAPTQITLELEVIKNQLETLAHQLILLEKTIDPILRPDSPAKDDTCDKLKEEPRAPLAHMLRAFNSRINLLIDGTRRITARVEL